VDLLTWDSLVLVVISPQSEFLSDREDPVSTPEQWADLASY
jgi:hypothetical protein